MKGLSDALEGLPRRPAARHLLLRRKNPPSDAVGAEEVEAVQAQVRVATRKSTEPKRRCAAPNPRPQPAKPAEGLQPAAGRNRMALAGRLLSEAPP